MPTSMIRAGIFALVAASISCRPGQGPPAAELAPSPGQAPNPGQAPLVAGPPAPRLGINLAAINDWNTELPFVDVFRLTRTWVSQKKGTRWGQGPKLDLDERGWIRRLEPGCSADTPLCTIQGGHYPAGDYVVLYDGRGEFSTYGAASVVSRGLGRLILRVDPRKGGFFLRLMATDPGDYVRNVRVLMPGHEKDYRDNPWNPAFLRLWRGMACLRFMDMMRTNGSQVASWADRPRVEDATFAPKGVPAELLIDLANRLGADAWFCIPHRADDEYVRNLARLVKGRLDPRLRAYVEYSNELWNTGFPQSAYAIEQGKTLGFSDNPREAGWRYTAHRSVRIFDAWEEVLGRGRIVRVLASQAANARVADQIASFRDAYKHADALAIAPYLPMLISPRSKPPASEVAGWPVDRLLDALEGTALPEAERTMRENKAVADRYGLKLVAYEGGQHMSGFGGGENDERLPKLLRAANADRRIGLIYGRYFDAWSRESGDLFCHYSSVIAGTKFGNWGLLEYLDEDPALSPKYMATLRWAKSLNQPVVLPNGPPARTPGRRAGGP